jgi:SAM-dependent methyltransferase
MAGALVRAFDSALLGLCGTGYFRLTRDATILERADYLAHYALASPQPKVSILDVGCGSAATLLWLGQHAAKVASYLGVDRKVGMQLQRYDSAPIPHAFRTVDLDEAWDFGRFDIVACLEVLEHLVHDTSLFTKLCSQVAPGGWLIVSTPSRPFVERMGRQIAGFDRISSTQDGDHVRMGYTADDFRAMAAVNAMEIVSVDWLSRYGAEELRHSFGIQTTTQRLWQNLRFPRTRQEDAWVIGGDPAICADTYWSIGVCIKHKDS